MTFSASPNHLARSVYPVGVIRAHLSIAPPLASALRRDLVSADAM
ncbi:hypothetical protein [Mycobacterium riyadhense]|nr:hypothetical protein [Mycobacterium riyadhense]